MKKIVLTLAILITLSALIFYFHNKIQNSEKQIIESNEISSQLQIVKNTAGNPYADTISDPSEYTKFNNNSVESYAGFLRNIAGSTDYDVYEFALRDLDNNGMPELLVVQSNEVGGILTVYSYNGEICSAGDYSDSKIGVAAFVVPDNPKLHGLFNLWWGGGVEHYGYLAVKEGKLTYEELYYIDRTGDTPVQVEISNNSELIDSAAKDFLKSDESGENTLDMYAINEENISRILENKKTNIN